jgi:hypothetical protein
MRRVLEDEIYRCDLCHRSVDADMRQRARRLWQPMIICERCIVAADSRQHREVALAA